MIACLFSIGMKKGGHFKTGEALSEALIESHIVDDGQEELIQSVSEGTPRVSGTGAASWEIDEKPHAEGSRIVGTVTNIAENKSVRYIPIANVRSKRNAGFIHEGVEAARGPVASKMKEGARNIAPDLWERD